MDLPDFEGTPRLYLIASTPRCGSHFLGHALTGCRHFGVPLEYLNKENLVGWRARFGTGDPQALLGHLVRHRTGATGWCGIKAHWTQYGPCEDSPHLLALGGFHRAIWISRRDLVAQSISYLIAQQTGQWISGTVRIGEPRFDYPAIVANASRILAQNTAWETFFRHRFTRPVHQVLYEDMVAEQERTFFGVTTFLDPEADVTLAVSPQTRKQSGGPSDALRAQFLAALRHDDRWILEPQAVCSRPD